MEAISMMEGLNLTLVSMGVVFMVLAALWALTEWIAKLVNKGATAAKPSPSNQAPSPVATSSHSSALTPHPKHQQVAELVALALASEDQSNVKLEIHETIRIK